VLGNIVKPHRRIVERISLASCWVSCVVILSCSVIYALERPAKGMSILLYKSVLICLD
jgi:uncharacterized membrane protein